MVSTCLLGIENGSTPSLTVEFSLKDSIACALTLVGLLDMDPATAKDVDDLDAIGDARFFYGIGESLAAGRQAFRT